MEKIYDAKLHEDSIYKLWEKSGAFEPVVDKRVKPFCIIMPPPNANDPLHLGHAMFVTVEDIFIRYHRMLGETTLWLPGADHAGIETQFVFEKKLKEQGKSRFDFDRETLYQKIWDYVQDNAGMALTQMKKIGASADWERFKFTLDPEIVKIVLETFIKLHKEGYVYRDLRLVNYCTSCGTAFSELEVKHVKRKQPLFYMKYGPFTLATVRPETKFGDTAVAVHPKDKRYKNFINKKIKVKGLLGEFEMQVVADEYVDPNFGTGVVKVTPAHDPNDFEIWQRHKEKIPGPKQVIGFDGRLNELTGRYCGLTVAQARQTVIEDLQKLSLLEKVDENYEHTIGVCYRCGTTIEPLPSPQFYIEVKKLKELALQALSNKKIKIYGSGHDKVLIHWLKILKDWNITRQIVWGIRLPIWYQIESWNQESHQKDGQVGITDQEIYVKFLDKDKQLKAGQIRELLKTYSLGEIKQGLQEIKTPINADYVVSVISPGDDYIQETDTFDTWFSSAQWPVLTLKTNKPGDFDYFYPTSVMETAYDILPFWVMRMLMMGLYLTGDVPFKNVYFHGLIRDEKGQKMSKSKGNVIDPIEVVGRYGADALRMALVIRSTPGQDKNVGEQDIRAMRNLTNKIWNATRYIVSRIANDQFSISKQKPGVGKSNEDEKFKKTLDEIVRKLTKQMDDFRIGLAAETIYNEFWHWFCDEVIEKNKKAEISNQALLYGFITFLKLFHPFVPFVTEVVYQDLKELLKTSKLKVLFGSELLISGKWPKAISVGDCPV